MRRTSSPVSHLHAFGILSAVTLFSEVCVSQLTTVEELHYGIMSDTIEDLFVILFCLMVFGLI
jgi:hypothetical protein